MCTDLKVVENENFSTMISNCCEDLLGLTSEDPLVQRSLDLFRDALRTRARDILGSGENFERLERTLTSIVGVIHSLDESALADVLSSYLETVRSSFLRLAQLEASGNDVLTDELITSYTLARERSQAELILQIANKTARMEEISKKLGQLTTDLGNQEVACKMTSDSIQLLEDTVRQLTERLTKVQDDLVILRGDHDIALAERVQLVLAQKEAMDELQATRVALAPLEQELATQISLSDRDLRARAEMEASRLRVEEVKRLKEELFQLMATE